MSTALELHDRLAMRQHDWLRKSLDTAGVSVGDMAAYLGVHRNTVGRWMSGTGARPTIGDLRNWARGCSVPLAYLELGVIPDDWTPVDSEPPARGRATLAQSAERFTRNDELHGPLRAAA